jgi:hypothetical protein
MYTPSITAVCPELPKGPPDLFFVNHVILENPIPQRFKTLGNTAVILASI